MGVGMSEGYKDTLFGRLSVERCCLTKEQLDEGRTPGARRTGCGLAKNFGKARIMAPSAAS